MWVPSEGVWRGRGEGCSGTGAGVAGRGGARGTRPAAHPTTAGQQRKEIF